MNIEALTVCVNYSDFLSVILPINKKYFNNWIIVTSPEDSLTKQICKQNDIQCVESPRLYEGGAKFNKGKALNDALRYLTQQEWIIHIDADIILPNDFRQIIENLKLDPQFLYGVKRMSVGNEPYVPAPARNLPYGYFQMFNKQAAALKNKQNIFPENYPNAGWYDVEFINYWQQKNIEMLDIKVWHIPHQPVVNWNGRKSERMPDELINSYISMARKWGKHIPLL